MNENSPMEAPIQPLNHKRSAPAEAASPKPFDHFILYKIAAGQSLEGSLDPGFWETALPEVLRTAADYIDEVVVAQTSLPALKPPIVAALLTELEGRGLFTKLSPEHQNLLGTAITQNLLTGLSTDVYRDLAEVLTNTFAEQPETD